MCSTQIWQRIDFTSTTSILYTGMFILYNYKEDVRSSLTSTRSIYKTDQLDGRKGKEEA